jgi:hypothetical protein
MSELKTAGLSALAATPKPVISSTAGAHIAGRWTWDDILREWRHHAEDLGWLAFRMAQNGYSDQAYAAAYCAAHYARCIITNADLNARGCPACADKFTPEGTER